MVKTQKLTKDLNTLEINTTALETKVDHLDQDLQKVIDNLDTSRVLKEKIENLDTGLEMASMLLGIVRIIPAISVAASNTKRVIDLYRKPVKEAARIAKNAEEKIKPVRDKVAKIKDGVTEIDNQFICAI